MKLENKIEQAKQALMVYWPLGAFIATNPLWGLRDQDFPDIVRHPHFNGLMRLDYYRERYAAGQITPACVRQALQQVAGKVLDDAELAAWVAEANEPVATPAPGYLLAHQWDEYQFHQPADWIKQKIFTVLRDYFGLKRYQDTDLLSFWRSECQMRHPILKAASVDSVTAVIVSLLGELKLPDAKVPDYLQAIYLEVYGWASFMNWRNQRPDNPWFPGEDPCEIVLLIWLSYEVMMAAEKHFTTRLADAQHDLQHNQAYAERCYIWQTAFELSYLETLAARINTDAQTRAEAPAAQFVFCIDTRSEGLRRHIEAQGPYETFGFAGFFGAIFTLDEAGERTFQAPALVAPDVTLTASRIQGRWARYCGQFKQVIDAAKKQFAAPYGLFEMLGFWLALFMAFKTLQPNLPRKKATDALVLQDTLTEEAQYQAAHSLLTAIGLVACFAPRVLICAHQSDNINNPFKSSLNCGACGGNSGVPNALVICQALNNPRVRARLAEAGIVVPDNTEFMPACHHTGYDRLEVLAGELDTDTQAAVARAAAQLRKEKIQTLPGKNALAQREQNWSELIPELGLINNAAIIIGPRTLTQGQNLARRVFLHSYAPALDPEAAVLTSILSAPAVVAHWISSQYYFSTVNPERFGAGNKAIHNVLPGIGVLEGNLSDLKVGLPLQSTQFQAQPMHEPRRLIVVVYAPKKILDKAIEQSPEFKTLLAKQWIYLKHIDAA